MREEDLKVKVSKYMSYLLRHNPDGLMMDEQGYVDLGCLVRKVRERFGVDEDFIHGIVEKSERRRFGISGDKIRALYGHSLPVRLELREDSSRKVFYHGTTQEAALKILRDGLKPMGRRWVHLSPTVEVAREVGYRRTRRPVILEIDAEKARRDGVKFYEATDRVYLCRMVPPRYIKLKE
jgi:putative RNA 2'-phosphotransferase